MSGDIIDGAGGIHNQLKKIYSYDSGDLNFKGNEWPKANDGDSFKLSKFDEELCKSWNKAMDDGAFCYKLDGVKIRLLEGNIGYVAQLNTRRFTQRRKPESINSVQEPFDPKKFNFTKVKEREILFEFKNRAENYDIEGSKKHLLVINVSPIEYGHVLLVPSVNECRPQVLSSESLKLAIEMCLLSTHRGFRIGFNSLCAFASVNHLHLHAFYLNQDIPLDRACATHCGHGLFELENYVVRGFAFQLENRSIPNLVRKVHEVTNHLYEKEIPHNLLICRGDTFVGSSYVSSQIKENTVKVFVFPKVPAPGLKDTKALNSCCFDLAGYLLLKDENEYEELTELQATEILNKYTLREDEFDELKDTLVYLLDSLTAGMPL